MPGRKTKNGGRKIIKRVHSQSRRQEGPYKERGLSEDLKNIGRDQRYKDTGAGTWPVSLRIIRKAGMAGPG